MFSPIIYYLTVLAVMGWKTPQNVAYVFRAKSSDKMPSTIPPAGCQRGPVVASLPSSKQGVSVVRVRTSGTGQLFSAGCECKGNHLFSGYSR